MIHTSHNCSIQNNIVADGINGGPRRGVHHVNYV
jgi:hypothetical protein